MRNTNPIALMKEARETLIDWLRDAHAMESNIVKMLEKQSKHVDNRPELKRRIDSHLQESRRHAEKVEGCLESLGSDTSSLKEGMAKLAGLMGQSSMGAATDEPVKICLGNIGIEHFEMASYRSLQTAAEHCGETQIAEAVKEILRDEESMAEFLESQLHEETRHHLDHHAHV